MAFLSGLDSYPCSVRWSDISIVNCRDIILPSETEILPLDTRSFAFVSFNHQFHSICPRPRAHLVTSRDNIDSTALANLVLFKSNKMLWHINTVYLCLLTLLSTTFLLKFSFTLVVSESARFKPAWEKQYALTLHLPSTRFRVNPHSIQRNSNPQPLSL